MLAAVREAAQTALTLTENHNVQIITVPKIACVCVCVCVPGLALSLHYERHLCVNSYCSGGIEECAGFGVLSVWLCLSTVVCSVYQIQFLALTEIL